MKKTTAKLLVAAMIGSSVATVIPSINPTAVYAEQVVYKSLSSPVSIENLGTIELKTIFTVPSVEGQVVTFTFDVVNTSQQAIDFNRYWFRLQTKDALRYPMRWVDESKFMIYPGEKKTLFFYTVVPNTVKMSDLNLRFVKWDSSVASFERTLAEIPIHAEVIPTLGRSLSKFIGLTDQMIEAKVQMDSVIENDQNVEVNYTLKMVNKGKFAYTVPEYKYVLVTNEGVSYPLTVNGSPVGQLLPHIEQKVELTGELPKNIDLDQVALYVLHPYAEKGSQVWLPVTIFRVFESSIVEQPQEVGTVRLGTKQNIVIKGDNSDVTATIAVTEIQRFPWDHRDLLSAKIVLENTGKDEIPLPQFTGSFKLDEKYQFQGQVLLNYPSEQNYLNPGQSVSYQIVGYIPYSTSFNRGYIELKELGSDKQNIIKSGRLPKVSFVEKDTIINQQDLAGDFEFGVDYQKNLISFNDAATYLSANGKVIVSRVVVRNLEVRGIDVPDLIAFYQAKDGTIYPATTSPYVEMNFPRGSSVISFYAEFPEEINQEDLQLIIGEKVEDKGIRNGLRFALEKDTTTVAERFGTFEFYPYVVTFSNIYADNQSGLRFKFTKEKAFNSIANLSDRKLVMEFTNTYGTVIHTEEVKLEGVNAWGGDVRIVIPGDPTGINLYTVTLYDEYNGARRALAKQLFYIWK